ncbi:MAG: AtpZ/AtpI family protein [Flavobacteriales bacterium]|nr:AtpZ/AtpI family protein [Bacteroidota bacterium]MDP4953029.1 AtpZ/AtpI family protein [Flavobacteriales bacterium]
MTKKPPKAFLRFSGMAFSMATIILIGVLGGRELDSKFENKTPWYTMAGSLLGVSLALYYVIKDLSKNR